MDLPENPNEPYRPPPIEEHGSVARQPLSFRAILSGVFVDWIATFASWTLISVMAAGVAASRYSNAKQMEAFLARLGQSPDFVILTAIVGLACVALGGFCTGRLARRDEARHALLMGAVSLAIGIVPTYSLPVWRARCGPRASGGGSDLGVRGGLSDPHPSGSARFER